MRSERANPNARNFGLKSRDMGKAGLNALREGMKSFSSIATIHDRWNRFATWVRSEHGVRDMRNVEQGHLLAYGAHLLDRFEAGQLSASTAQNYLSAVNRVMELARGDRQVRVDPVREAGLPKRSGIATAETARAVTQEGHDSAVSALPPRLAALLELQRNLGLRFEESAKIDAGRALQQALGGAVMIRDGTKGGREREIPITSQSQVEALRTATAIQGRDRSMIPADRSYVEFRQEAYQEMRGKSITFHGERHHYAQERYRVLIGAECPVRAGVAHGRAHHSYLAKRLGVSVRVAKMLDGEVRAEIARELGHGRIDVTNSYLG